jgi:hypothetical protein
MYVHCDVFHIALPPSPVSLSTDAAKYIAFILIRMTVMHFSGLRHSLVRRKGLKKRIKEESLRRFERDRALAEE